jgi:hypothetical protein
MPGERTRCSTRCSTGRGKDERNGIGRNRGDYLAGKRARRDVYVHLLRGNCCRGDDLTVLHAGGAQVAFRAADRDGFARLYRPRPLIVRECAGDPCQRVALSIPHGDSERLNAAVCSGCDIGRGDDVDGSEAGTHQVEFGDRASSTGAGEGAGGHEECGDNSGAADNLFHDIFLESPPDQHGGAQHAQVVQWAGNRKTPSPGHPVAECFSAVTNPGSHGVLQMQVGV